jgi:hypothetical protein
MTNSAMGTKILVLLAIVVGFALLGRSCQTTTPSAPATPATPAERAEAAKQQQELDANAAATAAARSAKFEAERTGIVAQAKKLVAERKYREAVDLRDKYLWADDAALDAIVAPAREKLVAAAMAKDRAERKKEGVRIGMTVQEVIESSWGKPEHVNRTTSTYGTREQWVYPGYHNYLYFENGVLTSIQN